MKKTNNKGFSLVELVIVIAIMAVLTAIIVPSTIKYINISRTNVCQTNMQELIRAYHIELVVDGQSYDDEDRYALVDNTVTNDFNCEIKETGKHIYTGFCPSGGEYTARIDADGYLNVDCSKHGSFTVNSTNFIQTLLKAAGSAKYNGQSLLEVKKNIDSEAGENANFTPLVGKELENVYGINPNKYTWRIAQSGGDTFVVQTPVDITNLTPGSDKVKVTVYSVEDNKYYTGTVGIIKQTYVSNGVKYNALNFNTISDLEDKKEVK